MQQELIEMLEKVVDHVVLCNEYDQRFSSTSYGVSLLKEAEALVEKAKNSAKEPAVPFDEQEAFEREMRSRHGWNNSYFTQSNDGGYLSNRATYAYIGWQARASIEKSAAKEPAVPQGWRKDLFTIVHAMGMNNWHWTSDASNDLKREAYSAAARLYNASAHATPAAPSQEPVPGQQPDTFRERNAQFREQNWQIRFDAAVEARRQAQEQLYSERERHNSEIQALRQEISRLLSSQQPVTLTDEPWYGHKFKEVTRGVWHCECGETVNEGATPCTNGTQSISTMRRDAVNVDATEMHDAGSAAHAGQGKFTRVDGSRSSLRGCGTQDDPFVADNLDDLAAAPTSPLQEPVTDDVPAHVEGLLEHRRELDAIEFFESTNRDSHGFRRSVRGTYVNPAVARDWKWFQLGMQHATKE